MNECIYTDVADVVPVMVYTVKQVLSKDKPFSLDMHWVRFNKKEFLENVTRAVELPEYCAEDFTTTPASAADQAVFGCACIHSYFNTYTHVYIYVYICL